MNGLTFRMESDGKIELILWNWLWSTGEGIGIDKWMKSGFNSPLYLSYSLRLPRFYFEYTFLETWFF